MVVVRPWHAVCDDDLRPALLNTLDAVTPAPGGLDRGLDRFRAGVHRQRHLCPDTAQSFAKNGPSGSV